MTERLVELIQDMCMQSRQYCKHSKSTPRRALSTHIGRGAHGILRHFDSSGKRKQAHVCTSCCAEVCARNHAHACVRTLANTRIIMFAVFRFTLDPHLHFAGASALELPMRATPPQRLRVLRRRRWFVAHEQTDPACAGVGGQAAPTLHSQSVQHSLFHFEKGSTLTTHLRGQQSHNNSTT